MMDEAAYRSSVRGCWLGKNIGGTLGAPFEGKMEVQDLSFYVQKDLNGRPVPNDDLDLQLLWLTLAEYYGVYRLTGRLLGEYWIDNIIAPCNEYMNCRWNCQSGFYPPLSGSVDNEDWKWSNGAWIRSEIWACLFPGEPDKAIEMAWLDASCDHCGEGVWAEMFTAALESLAFTEKDLNKLLDRALSVVPADSRLRRSIGIVRQAYADSVPWQQTRLKVLEENRELGNFQAPANVAFMVLGLLYGEGDFGRTVCLAANCGDDTDCTAATAGSVCGILLGAEGIPENWSKPIGDSIVTKYLSPFITPIPLPRTVTELTDRTVKLRHLTAETYPRTAPDEAALISAAQRLWQKSPYELEFELPFCRLGVEYVDGPYLKPGETCRLRFWIMETIPAMPLLTFRWKLPENWRTSRREMLSSAGAFARYSIDADVTPPETLADAMSYVPLEIRMTPRLYPVVIEIPFRTSGAAVLHKSAVEYTEHLSIEQRELITARR